MIENFLLIYDISDEETKYNNIYKILNLCYAKRIQKSVFLLQDEKKDVLRVISKIKKNINVEKDKLLLIPLCKDDWEAVEMFGVDKKEGIPKSEFYIL
ncbi:MAG: CRISPR-associated endonuclease Cas2 [Pleomorphochaeta sp.]